MRERTRVCATCEFWSNEVPTLATAMRRPHGSDPAIGTCHALPPLVSGSASIMMPRFPETHASRFCGDWLPVEDDGDGGPGGEEADAADRTVVPFAKAA